MRPLQVSIMSPVVLAVSSGAGGHAGGHAGAGGAEVAGAAGVGGAVVEWIIRTKTTTQPSPQPGVSKQEQ